MTEGEIVWATVAGRDVGVTLLRMIPAGSEPELGPRYGYRSYWPEKDECLVLYADGRERRVLASTVRPMSAVDALADLARRVPPITDDAPAPDAKLKYCGCPRCRRS